MSENKPLEFSLGNRIAAACVGSVMTSFVVNPFDVARVRMQQQSAVQTLDYQKPQPETVNSKFMEGKLRPHTFSPKTLASLGSGNAQLGVTICCKDAFWYPSSMSYCIATNSDPCAMTSPSRGGLAGEAQASSTIGVLRNIIQEEGAPVLWRGVSLSLVQAIPSNVVYFIAYENLRDLLVNNGGSFFQQTGPLFSGGLARALASSIVSPLELLKTRLQSIHVPQGESAMTAALKSIRDMMKIDGYRSLWSGLGLTLWRDVPFSSIYWLVVEAVRSQSPKRTHSNWEKFAESFASGIVGGVVASIVTTPFDVAKTRRQLGSPSCASAHMSMPRFMGTIARTEGWKALFVGLAPRTFKVAPACAIMITTYEMGKRVLAS